MNDQLAKRLAGAAELFFKKHGPAILTTAGVGGLVASNILTARAVLKSQDKVKSFKFKAQEIKARKEGDALVKYDNRKQAEDLGRLAVVDGFHIARDFFPAVLVGSASVICVISSHRMMRNKQASLFAAYAALDAGYRAYRERVREMIGEEAERKLYRSPRIISTEEGVEGLDGMQLEKCEIDYDRRMPSPYAVFFDPSNPNWVKTAEYNKFFLSQKQNWMNDQLGAYGFVFLNDVYQELGYPRTRAGQEVGWLRKDLTKNGDGFIDFGVYDISDEVARAFVNGEENCIMLDFNVDGPITIPE